MRNLLLIGFLMLFIACTPQKKTYSDYNISRSKIENKDKKNPKKEKEPSKSSLSEKQENLIDYGKKYLGTKYKYGGNTPKGFDCSGYTSYVYESIGVTLPRTSSAQSKVGKKIKASAAKSGDLMLFGTGKKIQHVGIVVENNSEGIFVMHSSSRGVVVDNVKTNSYWKKRILYARRVL